MQGISLAVLSGVLFIGAKDGMDGHCCSEMNVVAINVQEMLISEYEEDDLEVIGNIHQHQELLK